MARNRHLQECLLYLQEHKALVTTKRTIRVMLQAAQALETDILGISSTGELSLAYSFTLELAEVAPGIQAPNANTSDKNGSSLREFCLLPDRRLICELAGSNFEPSY